MVVEDYELTKHKKVSRKEEEKRRSRKAKIIKIILFIDIIGILLIAYDITSTEESIPDDYSAQNGLVELWKKTGFISNIDCSESQCVVKDLEWKTFNYDRKLQILLMLGQYCAALSAQDPPMMIIRGSTSGSPLAELSDATLEIK
jgi:hypothetical protein